MVCTVPSQAICRLWSRQPCARTRGLGWGWGQGCIGREGTSEAFPAAVGLAVGGGCQNGCGQLLSVANAIEAGTCHQGDSSWARLEREGRGGGGLAPPDASLLGGDC